MRDVDAVRLKVAAKTIKVRAVMKITTTRT
jgi:hypothetical protein